MIQTKHRSVEEMRKDLEELASKRGFEQVVLIGGFGSNFWSILKEDLVARVSLCRNRLETLSPIPDNLGEFAKLQAEIHVYGLLLNIERVELSKPPIKAGV